MKIFVLLLLLCVAQSVPAQPGPHSASFSFELYDSQGQVVTPARTDFRLSVTFPGQKPGPGNKDYLRSLLFKPLAYSWDGGWEYRGKKAYADQFPPGLRVLIVHGNDTMDIDFGLPRVAHSHTPLGTIVFRKGVYHYNPLFNEGTRLLHEGRVVPRHWEPFEAGHEKQLPYFTFERLYDGNFEEVVFHHFRPEYEFQLKPDSLYRARDTLFHNLGGRLEPFLLGSWWALPEFTRNYHSLVVYNENGSSVQLYEDTSLATRKVFVSPVEESSPGRENTGVFWLSIKHIVYNNGEWQALATIRFPTTTLSFDQQMRLTGWYRLRFDVPYGSAEYKRIMDANRALVMRVLNDPRK